MAQPQERELVIKIELKSNSSNTNMYSHGELARLLERQCSSHITRLLGGLQMGEIGYGTIFKNKNGIDEIGVSMTSKVLDTTQECS